MATTHIVKAGENLARIAKQYKIANWRDLYHHPDNSALRQLRPDPNMLFQGDQIIIPQQQQQKATIRTGAKHRFEIRQCEPQKLTFRLTDCAGNPQEKIPVVYTLNGVQQTRFSDRQGKLEIQLPDPDIDEFPMDIFADPESDQPTHQYLVKPSHLAPVQEVAGVQARLNSLGHDCGIADGIYGNKTKAGIESFEKANGMKVTGTISDTLCAAITREFGC